MAKAREIPGLTTELAYGEVAARVLEVRGAELIEHSAGVLDTGDIERLHAMRVASRRLRAAIEIFRPCLPKPEAGRALRAVKDLADALGERRDRDVAIVALEAFATTMPAPDRPGVRSLVARFEAEQEAANVALEPFVDPARLERIHEVVIGLAAAARAAAGGGPEAGGAAAGAAEPAAGADGPSPGGVEDDPAAGGASASAPAAAAGGEGA